MTVKGGTSPACAACKFQRRRCAPECPLARYFPADDAKKFQDAHRLFGVRNILKFIKNLDGIQKDEAMESIIYESYCRYKFPAGGCLQYICQLQNDIQNATMELAYCNNLLALCRTTGSAIAAGGPGSPPPPPPPDRQLQLQPDDYQISHELAQQQQWDGNNNGADFAATANYNSPLIGCSPQVNNGMASPDNDGISHYVADEQQSYTETETCEQRRLHLPWHRAGGSGGSTATDPCFTPPPPERQRSSSSLFFAPPQHQAARNHRAFDTSCFDNSSINDYCKTNLRSNDLAQKQHWNVNNSTDKTGIANYSTFDGSHIVTTDDQQSFIETEPSELSSESSLGDTLVYFNNRMEPESIKGKMKRKEPVAGNDLGSASVFFKRSRMH